MPLIEWDEKYNLGIASIDLQHKRLVGIINDLHDAHIARNSEEVIEDTVKKLIAYTVMHFGTEEKHFKESNYQGRESHEREHEAFIEKIKEFRVKMKNSKTGLQLEVLRFLKSWLIDHIQKVDQKYSRHLIAHGVK